MAMAADDASLEGLYSCARFACAASIVTHEPKEPAFYKSLLSVHEEIAHVTLEVNRCPG
jgi:hypothetical protein